MISGHAGNPGHGPDGCACAAPGEYAVARVASRRHRGFIYVLGSVDIRFPDQSISKSLQALARRKQIVQDEKKHLRTWCFRVLTEPEARYVARQVCWILTVEGHPAYYLVLRDLHDLPGLISCLGRSEDDLDLVVGSSTLTPVDNCPGITAPVLVVDHLAWFKRENLVTWFKPSPKTTLKPPSKGKASGSSGDGGELFDKLVQSADNFGDTDEWRALNYLAVNYQPLYEQYAAMAQNGCILDSVKVITSRLWRQKHIVDPVFAFRQIETGLLQKYFVRVDVSHLFPMIANHIAEYFDR